MIKVLVTLLLFIEPTLSIIISNSVSLPNAELKYHYDDTMSYYTCETLVLLGVGTAMSVDDYDVLSAKISSKQPIITVIADHFPGFFYKSSSNRFADVYNKLLESQGDIIPVCSGKSIKNILIGGHSSGGTAALLSLSKLKRKPNGYIGLDPFSIEENVDENLPVMLWGFSETTCQVKPERAAKATYTTSNDFHRILYRVNNTGGSVNHCSFTDEGCGSFCPSSGEGWMHDVVAKSIQNFSRNVKRGYISKDRFLLAIETDFSIDLFVNQEESVE